MCWLRRRLTDESRWRRHRFSPGATSCGSGRARCAGTALWAGAMPPSTSRRSKQDHCAEDGGEQRQPPPDAGADDDVADPSSAARRAGTGEEPGVSHRAHNESFCCDWVRALSRSNARGRLGGCWRRWGCFGSGSSRRPLLRRRVKVEIEQRPGNSGGRAAIAALQIEPQFGQGKSDDGQQQCGQQPASQRGT